MKPHLLLFACAPLIAEVPAEKVTDSRAPARGVDLCVIVQEHFALPHTLFANRTDVTVVPAHDESALGLLPNCSQH